MCKSGKGSPVPQLACSRPMRTRSGLPCLPFQPGSSLALSLALMGLAVAKEEEGLTELVVAKEEKAQPEK